MDIQRPVANNVQATSVSLYQQTMTTIEQLYSIPSFELYLFPEGIHNLMETTDGNPMIDPVAVLWGCFRLGAPLCHLINQFKPAKPLAVPDVSGLTSYNNTCKKCIYHFLIACKEELNIPESELFSISELYKDDTNGFVKVCHATGAFNQNLQILRTVNLVIAEMQRKNLFPPLKRLPFSQKKSQQDSPSDNRSKVINELLVTERKYIHDLQSLQVI